MSQVNIEDFINKHLVKVFYGLVVFFMYNIYIEFKEMKVILQQVVVNQATLDVRMSNKDAIDTRQDARIDKLEENKQDKK